MDRLQLSKKGFLLCCLLEPGVRSLLEATSLSLRAVVVRERGWCNDRDPGGRFKLQEIVKGKEEASSLELIQGKKHLFSEFVSKMEFFGRLLCTEMIKCKEKV